MVTYSMPFTPEGVAPPDHMPRVKELKPEDNLFAVTKSPKSAASPVEDIVIF
jgi:hypothetical protein